MLILFRVVGLLASLRRCTLGLNVWSPAFMQKAPSRVTAACPYRLYDGSGAAAEHCFCRFANNSGCEHSPCTCLQSCDAPVWRGADSVTFENIKSAEGCAANQSAAGLLTIPVSFYSDIRNLKESCRNGCGDLLVHMLEQGYSTYQQNFSRGGVVQCMHASAHVSAKWLHLHTFCLGGQLDGMNADGRNQCSTAKSFCRSMGSLEEARAISMDMVDWVMSVA